MRAAACGRAAALSLLLAGSVAANGLELELLGKTTIPGDLEIDDSLVGGLSGLTYDPGCDLFYALSDDKGRLAPPRFYTLRVELGEQRLDVEILGATFLENPDGTPYRPGRLDAEGIALAGSGELYVVSEGMPFLGVPPEISRFDLGGWRRGSLRLPDHYLPGDAGRVGVRENLGFESAAVSPDGSRLFVAVENALAQDGPTADLERSSPARILVMELPGGRTAGEYLYVVSPVAEPARPAAGFVTNGISEMVALDRERLLVVERAFSSGVGNRIGLYLVDLAGATDLREIPGLRDHGGRGIRPVSKRLLTDVAALGVTPDNLEAMALGPALDGGRRLLVMISDNNFQPAEQQTQVVVVAISGVDPPRAKRTEAAIHEVQGRSHVSPMVGRCVDGVGGVVTAILGRRGGQAFWIQDPDGDGDEATSQGLLVTALKGLPEVEIGDRIRAGGRIEERSWGVELPVTRLVADRMIVVGGGAELPEPVTLGGGGRMVPQPEIAAPDFREFDPDTYAADFFESLEGMRVAIPDPTVVGPTSRYGEFVVLADDGRGAELRTRRGGLRRLPRNPNPQRLIVDDAIVGEPPEVVVGDRLAGPVEGVLHATFGSYKVLNSVALPAVIPSRLPRQRTRLLGDEGRLTVATFNLENLSVVDDEIAFSRRASVVVRDLGGPDILAVQEIQDDSGAEDDGTVAAVRTLERLAAAIRSAGGPRYEWRSIDPRDGADGGRPGANIRNALLFNPARVEAVDRGECTSAQSTEVLSGPSLSCSPGVLSPGHWAFRPRDDGGGGSRKPLVSEFRFAGRQLFVLNLHLVSKGGDDPLFGRRQPRVAVTETRRLGQAEVVASFVREILQEDEGARVVVLGDLNDFEASGALTAIEAAGLENLVRRLPLADRYSYVYLGNSQVLDHVLVSSSLAAGSEIEMIHVNAEYSVFDRSSDHDPVIVRLRVAPSDDRSAARPVLPRDDSVVGVGDQ